MLSLVVAITEAEEWAGSEVFLMMVSLVISFVGLIAWTRWLSWGAGPGREDPRIGLMVWALVVSLAVLVAVTWFWSAREVRHGQSYTVLVLLMGTAWLAVCNLLFRWAGVGVGEDVCERRNRAASVALSGGLIGAMLVYCGANMGEGPSFWNNLFCLALGGIAWFGLWLALEAMAKIGRAVTEDRDVAAGVRLAGFLVAEGLVCGRALAGNWHSAASTATDFLWHGWPAAILLGTAALLEPKLRPNRANPFPARMSHGVAPALLFLGLAAVWVIILGRWEGMPG